MPNAQPRGSRHATDACIAARCAADAFEGLPDGMDRLELIRLVKSAGGRIGMNRRQIDYLAFQVACRRPEVTGLGISGKVRESAVGGGAGGRK